MFPIDLHALNKFAHFPPAYSRFTSLKGSLRWYWLVCAGFDNLSWNSRLYLDFDSAQNSSTRSAGLGLVVIFQQLKTWKRCIFFIPAQILGLSLLSSTLRHFCLCLLFLNPLLNHLCGSLSFDWFPNMKSFLKQFTPLVSDSEYFFLFFSEGGLLSVPPDWNSSVWDLQTMLQSWSGIFVPICELFWFLVSTCQSKVYIRESEMEISDLTLQCVGVGQLYDAGMNLVKCFYLLSGYLPENVNTIFIFSSTK